MFHKVRPVEADIFHAD